jgi:hypothetical protein
LVGKPLGKPKRRWEVDVTGSGSYPIRTLLLAMLNLRDLLTESKLRNESLFAGLFVLMEEHSLGVFKKKVAKTIFGTDKGEGTGGRRG